MWEAHAVYEKLMSDRTIASLENFLSKLEAIFSILESTL